MPEQLRTLGELGTYIARDAGQTLFSQGDTADAFYVLLGGKLEVWVDRKADNGNARASVDGEGTIRVKKRTIRVKVRGHALVVRETEDVDSAQIGVVRPGQMVTVVMEKMLPGRVRAMIAMYVAEWPRTQVSLPGH